MTRSTKFLLALVAVLLAANALLGWQGRRSAGENGVLRSERDAAVARADSLEEAFDATAKRALALASDSSRLAKAVTVARSEAARLSVNLATLSRISADVARDPAVSDSTLRLTILALTEANAVRDSAQRRADALALAERDSLRAAVRDIEASARAALLAERVAGMKRVAEVESRVLSRRQLFVRSVRDIAIGVAVDRVVAVVTP